jgi:hypothetical protein
MLKYARIFLNQRTRALSDVTDGQMCRSIRRCDNPGLCMQGMHAFRAAHHVQPITTTIRIQLYSTCETFLEAFFSDKT